MTVNRLIITLFLAALPMLANHSLIPPDYKKPTMLIPKIDSAPVIDGKLSPREWDAAAQTSVFFTRAFTIENKDVTTLHLMYDSQYLYAAFVFKDTLKRPMKTQVRPHDGHVYFDNALELFLHPNLNQEVYYHFAANALGNSFDCRVKGDIRFGGGNKGYNPKWEVRTSICGSNWIAELKIPFKELDGAATPQRGDVWGANFIQEAYVKTQQTARQATWAATEITFHDVKSFGRIIFGGPGEKMSLSNGHCFDDYYPLHMTITRQQTASPWRFYATAMLPNGKSREIQARTITDAETLLDFLPQQLPPQTSLVKFTLFEDKQLLYENTLPIHFLPPVSFRAENYPYAEKLKIFPRIRHDKASQTRKLTLTLEQNHSVLNQTSLPVPMSSTDYAALSLKGLKSGPYRITAQIFNKRNRQLGQHSIQKILPQKPIWWHSTAGYPQTVPPPWQPLHYRDGAVTMSCRTYDYDNRILPRQMISQNQPLLEAPISLQLQTLSKQVDLAALPARLQDITDRSILATASYETKALSVSVQSRLDFDGLIWFRLKLKSNQTTIKELKLQIPLKTNLATFIMPTPDGFRSQYLRTASHPHWKAGFIPALWLGNDRCGMHFYAEKGNNIFPHDQQVAQVDTIGNNTTMSINFVRRPLPLNGERIYEFGLQATPVKPLKAGNPFRIKTCAPFPNEWDGVHPTKGLVQHREYIRYSIPKDFDFASNGIQARLQLSPNAPKDKILDLIALRCLRPFHVIAVQWNPTTKTLNVIKQDDKRTATLLKAPFSLSSQFPVTVGFLWTNSSMSLLVDGHAVARLNQGLPWPQDFQRLRDKTDITVGCSSEWSGQTGLILSQLQLGAQGKPCLTDHLQDCFVPDGELACTRARSAQGKIIQGGVPTIGCRFIKQADTSALLIEMAPAEHTLKIMEDNHLTGFSAWNWFSRQVNGTYAQKQFGWPPPLFHEPFAGNLKGLASAYRQHGARLMPFLIYLALSNRSGGLLDEYQYEWQRLPLMKELDGHDTTPSWWIYCCHNSGFQDYIIAGAQRLAKAYHVGGFYTDSLQPLGCQNTEHGCGYRDEEGKLHPSYPLLANRKLLQRLYEVTHRYCHGGLLENHVSNSQIPMCHAFSDVLLVGEGERYDLPDMARLRYQERPMGIGLSLIGNGPNYNRQGHTAALLHGTSIRHWGMLGRFDMFRKINAVAKIYEGFDVQTAQWIPYYETKAQQLIAVDHPDMLVSLYNHPGEKLLLVVGNMTWKDVTGTIRLNRKKLHQQTYGLKNALTQQTCKQLTPDSFRVTLPPFSFKLLIRQ